ncbi:MAG: hypothetical protein ACRC1T_11785 [Clostridium chrysemydis]|uniref:hypothetical protein n=1 Tax=Clostridium TaxID=1485 RepID=UPI0021531891|nr:hypothetical protein [Clostridium sp. LY3-2]MCR6516288.1 hypothetical protein [Clostridium sp. LY3-2]
MLLKYLDKLKQTTTKEEFEIILKITEEDIKFNKIKFNKCTGPKEFLLICNRSMNLVKRYI